MFTWLWNIRHRRLINKTKAMIRMYLFLREETGEKETDKLDAKGLGKLLEMLKKQ